MRQTNRRVSTMEISDAIEMLLGRRETVPKPARLPTTDEIDAAEDALGISFHPDYRHFQMTASNVVFGHLEPARLLPETQAYLNLLAMNKKAWSLGLRRDVLAFCQDNGNYYFITAEGKVGFYDHDDETADVGDATLADWIVDEWLEG